MNPSLNQNKVQIDLSANNYYIQLTKGNADRLLLLPVALTPMQIQRVEIKKSYETHVTDITVWFDNLDPDVAAFWAEGKYIARLSISQSLQEGPGISNYFICSDLVIDTSIAAAPTASYTMNATVSGRAVLTSITRMRLERENNFPFELGGKDGNTASGAGFVPLHFMYTELKKLYNQNYAEDGLEAGDPWNLDYCDLLEQTHLTTGTPSNGYRIITDNNFEALDFFFKHYPIFNTPYVWLLDDFNMSSDGVNMIRLLDLAMHSKWKTFLNKDVTAIINKEINNSGDPTATQEYLVAAVMKLGDVRQIYRAPYYNWVTFFVKTGFPKIYAIDVSSNKPIPMNKWNGAHEKATVLTPGGNIKSIDNPMYAEYLTFMNENEITQTQRYKLVLQNLRPTIQKFTLANMPFGAIDLHTVIEFKKENLSKEEYNGYDRLGVGYEVKHTFMREKLSSQKSPRINEYSDGDPVAGPYSYNHSLVSEITFLVVDEGPLDLPSIGLEDAVNVSTDPAFYNPVPIDPCKARTGVDGVSGGTDGIGLPGNTSIADQGQAMVDKGFTYDHSVRNGGRNTTETNMDCSVFTQRAVHRAGVSDYPGSTPTQQSYCINGGADRIKSKEFIKRGDILFFLTSRGWGHTGIATGDGDFLHASSSKEKGVKESLTTRSEGKTRIYRLKRKGSN